MFGGVDLVTHAYRFLVQSLNTKTDIDVFIINLLCVHLCVEGIVGTNETLSRTAYIWPEQSVLTHPVAWKWLYVTGVISYEKYAGTIACAEGRSEGNRDKWGLALPHWKIIFWIFNDILLAIILKSMRR